MTATATKFLSIADIARNLNVPRHRIVWVLDAYAVAPAVEVGDCKGYTNEAQAEISKHLERIYSSRLSRI